MITRRKILTGTAAASIAAIASARGVEAASPGSPAGIDVGLGDLAGGAFAVFHKDREAFSVSLKWEKAAAEVFYKPQLTGGVERTEIFYKLFFKGWTPVTSFPLAFIKMAPGTEAMFKNVGPNGAEFFLKDKFDNSVLTTLTTNSEGLNVDIVEDTPGTPEDVGEIG